VRRPRTFAVSDNFPAGLQVASVPDVTNTCGGTPTANAGGSRVSLSGGTVAALSSCSITVVVTEDDWWREREHRGSGDGDDLPTPGRPATASVTVTQ
jgi:hypothetical protein